MNQMSQLGVFRQTPEYRPGHDFCCGVQVCEQVACVQVSVVKLIDDSGQASLSRDEIHHKAALIQPLTRKGRGDVPIMSMQRFQ